MSYIVITGGGTGIGLATARRYAGRGDRVAIIGRRAEVLDQAAADLNAACGERRVHALAADLTDPAQVARVAERIAEAGEPVDVLVNNAGGSFGPAQVVTLEDVAADYRENFEGNVLSVVLLTHALLPQLTRPGGSIVTVTSIAAVRGPGAYGGSKAQLHAATFEWATKYAAEGIRANAVAPGFTEATEFFGARMTPEFHAGRSAQSPLNRAGTPDEVAEAIEYLAGAANVTGQILHVNGGTVLGR